MLIKVPDPTLQTVLFSIIFLCLLFVFTRKRQDNVSFSREVTDHLKGFAILAIIFSHIGYFLSTDTKFLYPYSILAGVGVNLFLFLSGFGLTFSQIKSPCSILSFYKKRLIKLFTPLWIVVAIFFLMDFLILQRTYPVSEMIQNFLGFYPKADLFQSLDSPLWYFSIILSYYLIFPLLFIRKIPWLSPILVLITTLLLFRLPLPVDPDVLKLYKLHYLAFPLGMGLGLTIQRLGFKLHTFLKVLILAVVVLVFLYTAVNSDVGQGSMIEQSVSLITTLSLVIIFSLAKFKAKLLSLFGIYSYEAYLLHWPIISRYNLFLSLPPFLNVALNLVLIISLGYLLQKAVGYLNHNFHHPPRD